MMNILTVVMLLFSLTSIDVGGDIKMATHTIHDWVINHHAEESHPHWMVDVCSIGKEERVSTTTQASWSWEYGSWYSISSTTHKRVKTCSRCGDQSSETSSHSFGSWVLVDTTTEKRTCSVCGYEETRTVSHIHVPIVGNWEYYSSTQCRRLTYCSCGEILKTEYKSHNYLATGTYGEVRCEFCKHTKGTGSSGTANVSNLILSSDSDSVSASASFSYVDAAYWEIYNSSGSLVGYKDGTSSSSFYQGGLNPSSTYTVKVIVYNWSTLTQSETSSSITTKESITPPSVDNVIASTGDNWISIDVFGSNINSIEATLTGNGNTYRQTASPSFGMTSFNFDGLSSGVSYSYSLVIRSSSGGSITRTGSASTTIPHIINSFYVGNKTENSITVYYSVSGSGSLVLSYSETYGDTSLTTVSLNTSGASYTISGLKNATDYTLSLGFVSDSKVIYVKTLFGNFKWDSGNSTKTAKTTFDIKASEWERLALYVNAKRKLKGLSTFPLYYYYNDSPYVFSIPSYGEYFYAFYYNQMVNALGGMTTTGIPNQVKKGDTLTASSINGLINCVNSIIVD